jgi:hypothetical protein
LPHNTLYANALHFATVSNVYSAFLSEFAAVDVMHVNQLYKQGVKVLPAFEACVMKFEHTITEYFTLYSLVSAVLLQ